ncbi:MAG TPA: Uma2 family endonuclease [Chthoniobacteraceae bacterium]|jgi:Uma2 family endonuclease|nr:Uma2 family endonuclease [Chthoniobacteraceae bacterium]
MKSSVLTALLESPALPEIIQEAHAAWERELKLREKFRADITPEHKWEFIQGEVVMHSPALNRHLLATQRLFKVLDAYVTTRRCGEVRLEKALTVFPRNDYEPDVVFFGLAKVGLIDADTLRFPIPDFVVEVLSPTTEERDRGIKFLDYALHGVGEYWIIDPVVETVEAHRLADGVYPPAPRQDAGLLASDVVPGFEIPVRAIFDEAENLAALRRILAAA